MSCKNGCFEALLQQCDDIIIRAGFPSNLQLYWTVQKVGKTNIYQKLTSTENNGDLIIDADVFPDGFLFPGDHLKIGVRLGANYLQPVQMIFDGLEYECIQAKLQNVVRAEGDTSEVNVITGSDAQIPAGPGTNYLTPITSADFLTDDAPPVPHPNIYLNDGFTGKVLEIFWNDASRYLTQSEFQHVTGGIQILVPGFDATVNNYSLKIYIVGNEPS